MADEEENTETDGEEKPKKDRGPLKMLGAVLALVGVGGGLAMMAIPSKPEENPTLQGPLHDKLFEDQVVSNTTDANFTRFIKTDPQIEYFAYDPLYVDGRDEDPLFRAWISSELNALISSQGLDLIYNGTNRERFAQMVREVLTPSVFPVHLGNTKLPLQVDEDSGIRPGDSYRQATFRGRFYDHVLKIDAPQKTLQIDEGPVTVFEGDEIDLEIRSPSGETMYVDLSELKPEFVGEIRIGVHGRIRQVFLTSHIAQ